MSVSLLAGSAPEVKAKWLVTYVGVPSGQRRSPYLGGVCHRVLTLSTGVSGRVKHQDVKGQVKLWKTQGATTWSHAMYCCVESHSGHGKSRSVDDNVWSLSSHSGVYQNSLPGRCVIVGHCM